MGELNVEQRGRVLVATVATPPHGLMDNDIVAGLAGLVRRAEGDDEVGAVVLTGAHPERFVAHYDVGELLAGARSGPSVSRVSRMPRCGSPPLCVACPRSSGRSSGRLLPDSSRSSASTRSSCR